MNFARICSYFFGLVLLAAFASPAAAQSFLGTWTATATTPGGDVSETLTVVRTDDGYAITVKAAVPPAGGAPEAGPGTKIVINGDNFSYQRAVTFPGGEIVISYQGVVSGDRFTGTAEVGGVQVPYNGART
jgi:hypothetical protein